MDTIASRVSLVSLLLDACSWCVRPVKGDTGMGLPGELSAPGTDDLWWCGVLSLRWVVVRSDSDRSKPGRGQMQNRYRQYYRQGRGRGG
ncbi:hypothetical protein BCR37DRAFT_381210 [Protomyces lactucae-debilis]|uniref:Secreted protein n=1 Tax=Protomyces lactucae-debilis TaxID=2754530 RepID=A0A1Y2F9F3_PROLT|nr:uncharacterized protein BCR37DRAFT_381210 [Protomyces lactucae-debilis]ORY80519.1 hypothetical protein BCR37DRAFT_381210 [Protomyces lactucae-debilis]